MSDPLPPDLAAHYEDPYHCGPLDAATHAAERAHVDCVDGRDLLLLELKIGGGVIEEAWFQGEGCPWSQAAASLLAEVIEGSSADSDVSAIEQQMEAVADELTESRRGCFRLAAACLRDALRSPLDDEDGPTFSGPNLGEEQ